MIKKKVLAIVTAMLIAVATMMAAVGCGGSRIGNTEQSLEVYVWRAGYGSQYMWDLLKDFSEQDWVKEKYPDLEYDVIDNTQQTFAADRIGAGPSNTIDLFMSAGTNGLWESGNLLDLTEMVYNQKVPGENVYYKDKMSGSLLGSYSAPKLTGSAQYFVAPATSSMGGIIYNATLFEELGLEVPNTTDEMFALCKKVYDMDGKNPNYSKKYTFTSSKVSYIGYMFNVWWAQYEGVTQYDNYYKGIYYDKVNDRTFANDVRAVSQKGRLEALKIFEKIFRDENGGYFNKSSVENDYIQGQTMLFLRDGLMIGCGDWFSTEMREIAAEYAKEGYTDTMGMMNGPVISSIVDHCPTITAANANKIGLATADALLSAVIDAVDAGDTAPSGNLVTAGVSQDDFDTVRDARGVIYSIAGNEVLSIPSYSNAKELACDFLLYMASDRGNYIFAKSNYGVQRPFNYKLNEKAPELDAELTEKYGNTYRIQKDRARIWDAQNTYILPWYENYPMMVYGGLKPHNGDYEGIEATFIDPAKKDISAQDIFKNNEEYWTKENNLRWNNALRNANLI